MLELFETTQQVKIRLCPYTFWHPIRVRFFVPLQIISTKLSNFILLFKILKNKRFQGACFLFYNPSNSPTNPRKMGGQRQLSHKSQRGISAIFEG